ncbi:putative bifunctional diguanylate cyclase/phosphodiesterase [Azospirillum ramasamyi]|uniref:putative bifunctional diguanylate cyclase/phosphodiesterase n=1 Tax=Azospirillum ramasamyi TaxID=682998 RepID=UPI001FE78DC4|nr:EAL domain-containing protein [Azospirillum ramasamyi]
MSIPWAGGGIAVSLLYRILLFSTLITLMSTALQLYFDFRRGVSGIEERFDEIRVSTVPSMSNSLWVVDHDQLRLLLNGIILLPDIRMAEVREFSATARTPLVLTVGTPQERPDLHAEIPLIRVAEGKSLTLGTLRVEASLDDVYHRLLTTAEVILISQGVKTFLVSGFILFIFHRLLTRHLISIAASLRQHDRRSSPPLLTLDRPQRKRPDELDQLIRSLNDLAGDLYAANCELAGANAALENDIALRRSYEEQLYRQAHFDELTGLANRLLTRDRLEQAILNSRRSQLPSALLFIDLDNFKNVNDTLGHEAGDTLLREAATRLSASIRQGDTLARMGGDEFLIVLPGIAGNVAARGIAERVLESFAPPFRICGQDHYVTASIGIALYPSDGGDGPELLRNADLALYRAKERGRNRYEFFTAEINERVQRRIMLESRLRLAVLQSEFVLHYQPIVEAESRRPAALEALLRWRQPDGTLLAPGHFICVAEEAGLIGEIGAWVVETAIRETAGLFGREASAPRVAVNVSPRQLRDPCFVIRVMAALAAHGLPPGRLELEITEGVLMDEAPEVTDALNTLCGHGVRLSIDDFGTGYSSLSYLQRYPFDMLKIDRCFVSDATDEAAAARLVETIIMMAHGLGLETIAEGVETEEQFRFLQSKGCDLMQGYLMGRPAPLAEIAARFATRFAADAAPPPPKLLEAVAGDGPAFSPAPSAG